MTQVSAVFSLSIGIVVLLGWLADVPTLRSVLPGLVEMKANTAVCFVATGAALWLLGVGNPVGWRQSLGRALAGFVTALALATMSEHVFGWNLGIDQLLFQEAPGALFTSSPGRMAFVSTLDFALLSVSLQLLDVRPRRGPGPAQAIALLAAALALLALLGYLYGATALYGVAPRFTSIALHTAIGFFALATGVVLCRSDRGIAALVSRPGPGGRVVRRLWPATVLVPMGLGWLSLWGQRAGKYPPEVGMALVAIGSILIFATLVWWGGISLERADAERRCVADALESNERRYRALAQNFPNGAVAIFDRDLRYTLLEGEALTAIGWSKEDQEGRTIWEALPPDTAAALEPAYRATLLGERTQSETVLEGRTFLVQRTPIHGDDGEIEAGMIVALDITERKQAEQDARQSETFLNSVIEHLPTMVFVKDAEELRFVRFNAAGEELLGIGAGALLGKNDHDLFPPDQAEAFQAKDREVLTGGRLVDIPEEPIETRDGLRLLHTRKVPILDVDGEPRYLLGISEDITDRRRAEDDLLAAKAEAERANLAKDQFLSRMSHELRTPLNAILGFGQLLEMDLAEPENLDSVKQILSGGRHLLSLINEVLDISRISAGTMSLSSEPVAVLDVVSESLALIRPLADEHDVVIGAQHANGLHVLADRQRLKQVLLNLLSNGVKYNRPGGRVDISLEDVPPDRLRIRVADTGVGVSPAMRDRLFAPFDRLGAEAGGVEGTGLGLALSRGLTEAMGGTLGIDDAAGTGTTFVIELPLAPAPFERYEEAPVRPPPVSALADRRTVLCIEDNASNIRLMERVLESSAEIHLLTAMHAGLGIDLARQHAPDLILLDLHLPDQDGEAVLRSLKEDPLTAHIPVIVLSADAMPRRVERLLSNGAHDYLTKPLDVQRFIQVVEAALGTDRTSSRAVQ